MDFTTFIFAYFGVGVLIAGISVAADLDRLDQPGALILQALVAPAGLVIIIPICVVGLVASCGVEAWRSVAKRLRRSV